MRNSCSTFSSEGHCISELVWDMKVWRRDGQGPCYCTQELFLREWLIVGNVVDLSSCLIAVSAEE